MGLRAREFQVWGSGDSKLDAKTVDQGLAGRSFGLRVWGKELRV